MWEVLEGCCRTWKRIARASGVSGAGRLFTACAQQPERT